MLLILIFAILDKPWSGGEVETLYPLFAMAQIRRIGHDHQAPFWHLLVLVVFEVSSGDAKRKQAATRGEYSYEIYEIIS